MKSSDWGRTGLEAICARGIYTYVCGYLYIYIIFGYIVRLGFWSVEEG